MSHISRPELTFISGPVIEPNGLERLYVAAYVPETVSFETRMKVQECIGFLAVPDRDHKLFPQPRDGWVVRPTGADEETIKDFAKFTDAKYEHQSSAIPLHGLKALVGKEAVDPRKPRKKKEVENGLEADPLSEE